MCDVWRRFGLEPDRTADPKRGYSTYSERIMHPKTQVKSGVLKEECEALMSEFFASLRK